MPTPCRRYSAAIDLFDEHLAVEILGHLAVIGELLGDVDLGVVHHAHLGERLLHARAPQADVLHRRHDAAEQAAAEGVHLLGIVVDLVQHLGGQAEPLPDFRLVEAVAHEMERLDDELLALVALGVA